MKLPSTGPKALIAIFVAFLVPAYWIAFHAPAVGIYHDDGIYLVTAKALAEGKGYRIISLPGELTQTKYPILFPGILSVAWKIFPRFPDNAKFMKTLPLLFAILWLWLSYKLIREETGVPDVALWIVLLTAASSWVVFFSTTIMSETLFACLCAGALIWLKRLEAPGKDEGVGWTLLISSALVAASFLTRTAGAPLIAAGAISLFFKRKYIAGVMFLFICAILIAPWFWWQSIYADSGHAMDPYYSASNYNNWNILMNFTSEQKLQVLLMNLIFLVFSPIALLNMKGYAVVIIISLVFTMVTCLGFIRDLRQDIKLFHLFLFFYCGTIIMWAWPPHRFLLPTIPFLLLYAYKGFSRICGRISKSGTIQAYASLIIVVLLSIQMIYGLLLSTGETLKRQTVSFVPSIYQQDNWKDTRALLDWVRQNTPQDSILLGNLDPTYYLYTGRKAVRGFTADPFFLFYSEKPDTALGQVSDLVQRIVANRIRYVIRTPSLFFKDAVIFNGILDRLILDYPGALHLVKVGTDPSYRVYEVDQERLLYAPQSRGGMQRDGHGPGVESPK